MPASVMEQLGTPFLQADLSYCRRWQGVGLGLALALRITRSHGGQLSLIPRSDGGTVAEVELPLSADGECQDATEGLAGDNDVGNGHAANWVTRQPSNSALADSGAGADVQQKFWWSN